MGEISLFSKAIALKVEGGFVEGSIEVINNDKYRTPSQLSRIYKEKSLLETLKLHVY